MNDRAKKHLPTNYKIDSMDTLRSATILSTIHDSIELYARNPTRTINKLLGKRVFDGRHFTAKNVAQLAEMGWAEINNKKGGLDSIYKPVTTLAEPQKFRMRISITEELFEHLLGGIRKRKEKAVLDNPRKAKIALLMLLTHSMYITLKEYEMLKESSMEEFATNNVRCFDVERLGTLVRADIILSGYLFCNAESVRLMQKAVIRNFKVAPTPFNQNLWFRERLFEVFPMDIYEQYAPIELPYIQYCFPLAIVYYAEQEKRIFIGKTPDVEDLHSAKSYEILLRDALLTMDKKTANEAILVDTAPLKKKKHPTATIPPNVVKEDFACLLMREYDIDEVRMDDFFISRTPKDGMWKLHDRKDNSICPLCARVHKDGSFLVVKDDGRVFIGCRYAEKGKKTKYIGLFRGEIKPALQKIELKIALFMSELLGLEIGALPFDLVTYNGGASFFANLWKDMRCPLCKKTHTHRDPIFVTHASETGAFFLRCGVAKNTTKPFLLLGHLMTTDERRLTALDQERCIKLYIVFGVLFPDYMDEWKRNFFLAVFKDESHRFTCEEYNRRFLERLVQKGTVGPLHVGTLIIQSVCGTGKTYNVFLLLLEARLREKMFYHERLSGYVALNPINGAKRVTAKLNGESRRDVAFEMLSIREVFDTDNRAMCTRDTGDTGWEAPAIKESEAEDYDVYSDLTDEIDDIYGKDHSEACGDGYINYFKNPTSEGTLVQDNSLLAVDPFVDDPNNMLLFDALQGDGYVEPETLEKISDALDAIHPDIEPSVLWISTRRTYARDIYSKYGDLLPEFVLYLDENGMIDQERLIISIESLVKCARDTRFDYIVLDEISSVLEQLYSPHLRNIEETRKKFCELVANAKNVICMDADITSETLYWLSRLREGNIRFLDNTFQRKLGNHAIYYEKLDDMVLELHRSLKRGEKAHVVCPSKKKADELAQIFSEFNPLLITSETNTSETKKLLEDINKNIHDYGLLIHTSTISVGTDVWVEYSTSCYLIANPRIVNSRICMQMTNRVRISSVLHWYVKPYRRDEPLELPDIFATARENFISSNELRHLITSSARIGMHESALFDLDDPWVVSYLYRVQSENMKLTCLKEMLEWRIEAEGYTMTTFKEDNSELHPQEKAAIKESQKAAAVEVEKQITLNMSVAMWVNVDEETDSSVALDDEWTNGTESTSLGDRKTQYELLGRAHRSGDIKESDRWVYKKSRIMNLIRPAWREELHKDGVRLRKLEKEVKRFKKMKRVEPGIDQLIKKETERFEKNPSVDMSLGDDNLKLAVIVYISQLLGLKGPSEEKEVSRVSKRLTQEERKGKSASEVRIAEGSLESCVDWIALHQSFITGVFGTKWKKSFNELRPNLRNRGLQSLFSFGISNRLDFMSKRRIAGERVNIIQNKCKLNDLVYYFS